MAAAIDRLLSNPALARTLGQSARQAITDHFSLDRMVAATAVVYEDLLARKQRQPAAAGNQPGNVAIDQRHGTA